MKKSNIALTLALSTILGACSTITTGTTQPLLVKTPYAEGASCSLVDTREGTWRIQQTPQTVEVTKGDGPMTITCEKPGHKTEIYILDENFAGATLGNIILGGGVGVIVDAASGAAQEYPDEISLWLQPNKFASAEARKNWMEERDAYKESLKPASQQQQKPEAKSTGNFNKKQNQ